MSFLFWLGICFFFVKIYGCGVTLDCSSCVKIQNCVFGVFESGTGSCIYKKEIFVFDLLMVAHNTRQCDSAASIIEGKFYNVFSIPMIRFEGVFFFIPILFAIILFIVVYEEERELQSDLIKTTENPDRLFDFPTYFVPPIAPEAETYFPHNQDANAPSTFFEDSEISQGTINIIFQSCSILN